MLNSLHLPTDLKNPHLWNKGSNTNLIAFLAAFDELQYVGSWHDARCEINTFTEVALMLVIIRMTLSNLLGTMYG